MFEKKKCRRNKLCKRLRNVFVIHLNFKSIDFWCNFCDVNLIDFLEFWVKFTSSCDQKVQIKLLKALKNIIYLWTDYLLYRNKFWKYSEFFNGIEFELVHAMLHKQALCIGGKRDPNILGFCLEKPE